MSENKWNNVKIVSVGAEDVRFPTALSGLHGSDAVHKDPDYSCVYVSLYTSQQNLIGHGLTFTIGRGNDLVKAAVVAFQHHIIGRTLGDISRNFGGIWEDLVADTQLRWLGPEKGVTHLAIAAIVNALWDLWAKAENKPLWRLLTDMPPEQLVSCINFRWITDAITPEEALHILKQKQGGKAERIIELEKSGYPAYTTSVGWLGYTDDYVRQAARDALQAGFTQFKAKVGNDVEADKRRLALIREEIGYDKVLMVDANQRWDVPQAIEYMKQLAPYKPLFIEEPTCPDDILGHATIREALKPYGIKVATGEAIQNRVIFKQFMQAKAFDFVQIDSCRVGGVNENLAIILMAAKFGIPVVPHSGGVGLCELVQHLIMWDYTSVSGTRNVCEFVDHLHEHFVHPVVMKNAHYMAPTAPGYSTTMKAESVSQYTFPTGAIWQNVFSTRNAQKFAESEKKEVKGTYLITGAQGFIGAWIIKQLLQHNQQHPQEQYRVVGLDLNRNFDILEQIMDDVSQVEMLFGDLSDYQRVKDVMEQVRPNYIIHLGALQIPACRANPRVGANVNVIGTINVFEAAKHLNEVEKQKGKNKNHVECVVYASSAGAYGPPSDYPDETVDDDANHRPRNHYGVFKLANEGNARVYWLDHGIASVALRPLTVYGVGREMGMTSAPTKAIKAVLLSRPFVLPFSGHTSFDFVEDVARYFIQCALKVKEGNHSCSIQGTAVSLQEFVEKLTQVLPQTAQLVSFAPNPVSIPFPYKSNSKKLLELIGEERSNITPLSEGIARTVQHFKQLQSIGKLHARDL